MSTANKAKKANKKALLDDPEQATHEVPFHLYVREVLLKQFVAVKAEVSAASAHALLAHVQIYTSPFVSAVTVVHDA